MGRLRQIIAIMIGLCPLQSLKRLLYRWLLGYQIDPAAWIGFALIEVDRLVLGPGARISHLNRIQGLHLLELGAAAEIKHGNTIVVSRQVSRSSAMTLGPRSIVTRGHFFDLSGNISVGENTVLGGVGSQFWTHSFDGARAMHVGDIHIGSNCFIGSAVRFSPASRIGDDCVVGIGAVVTRAHTDTHVLIAGVPARVVRQLAEPQPG